MPIDPAATNDATALAALIDQRLLVPHFQPIVQLLGGSVHGHEALIRTPSGCRGSNPDELFGAARGLGLSTVWEVECVRAARQAWSRFSMPGRLYLNLSAVACRSRYRATTCARCASAWPNWVPPTWA